MCWNTECPDPAVLLVYLPESSFYLNKSLASLVLVHPITM